MTQDEAKAFAASILPQFAAFDSFRITAIATDTSVEPPDRIALAISREGESGAGRGVPAAERAAAEDRKASRSAAGQDRAIAALGDNSTSGLGVRTAAGDACAV